MPATAYGLNRSLGAAIAAIALVSLLAGGLVLTTVQQLRNAIATQARSAEIIRAVDDFLAAMLNQETGLRGYLITGREKNLDPYREGGPALDAAVGHLHALVDADPDQAARLLEAERSARAWQTDVGEAAIRGMADPATRDAALDIERRGAGQRYFDVFRNRLAAIQHGEERMLASQESVLARAERRANLSVWAGTLLTLLICAGIGIAINRFIVRPLVGLAAAMGDLTERDFSIAVPGTDYRNEVGAMARAVEVFKQGLIQLDRTSLFRATADTLPALVGYVDRHHRVGFLNAEFGRWFRLAGDPAALFGRPLDQVFGAAAFPGAGRQLEAALAGTETRFDQRLTRPGSGWRELEAVFRPHRAADGAVLGVVTLLTDITERKRMERRLASQAADLLRSNEELEQFAYVASHDLKAPLRGIENLVSWIEEDLEGTLGGDTRTNMDLLKSRVRRLENLLDDLLAYSRAGRADAAIDRVDTGELVRELAGLVSPPEGFAITGSPALPTIDTARAPLTQALQNLIGNAIKHHDHPHSGRIEVDARAAAGMIEFSVTDDGPGIPPQFRDRVFGMFQTLKPRDEVEGSGMGLAIVRKLVRRQGGEVWLRDAPGAVPGGRGLSVHFTWPDSAKGTVHAPDGEPAAG